jgi:palmitoyl-protein thioesterase
LNNVYSVCIPTGKSQKEDTTNGYFLNMDASVDVFAQAIQADPKLQDGFHAIGLSQGNNVIRGYIARYNEPAVNTFISINGVNGGTGALPNCFPSNEKGQSNLGGICSLLMEQASRRAYTDFAQQHSFQANYWRDPRPAQKEAYQEYSQLARWNNEGEPFNQTLKDNFAKTTKFVWVMANEDKMVWPKEGEHWGAADRNAPLQRILPRNQTEWYINDSFGLKTAEEAGKNHYISFDGDHLQFTMDDYTDWVRTYLGEGAETNTAIQ